MLTIRAAWVRKKTVYAHMEGVELEGNQRITRAHILLSVKERIHLFDEQGGEHVLAKRRQPGGSRRTLPTAIAEMFVEDGESRSIFHRCYLTGFSTGDTTAFPGKDTGT